MCSYFRRAYQINTVVFVNFSFLHLSHAFFNKLGSKSTSVAATLSRTSPGTMDLQLTSVAGEEDRLLGAYDDGDSDNLRRIQVGVSGMTCAACSNSVESALRSLDGVVTASVALLQNKADISFNSSLLKVSLTLSTFLGILFNLYVAVSAISFELKFVCAVVCWIAIGLPQI